jgi:inward rectifier potassium channel
MFGLLSFALATGILYGRFSRPKAEIIYSKKMVMAPYRGISGLMFRIANGKQNELIELEAQVILSMNNPENGSRIFQALDLERNKLSFLALTWTIVHPVDEKSLLIGLNQEDLISRDAELLITIKAINDTYSQTVYSRSSYKADEILWGSKFSAIQTKPDTRGKLELNLTHVDSIEAAPLPVYEFS